MRSHARNTSRVRSDVRSCDPECIAHHVGMRAGCLNHPSRDGMNANHCPPIRALFDRFTVSAPSRRGFRHKFFPRVDKSLTDALDAVINASNGSNVTRVRAHRTKNLSLRKPRQHLHFHGIKNVARRIWCVHASASLAFMLDLRGDRNGVCFQGASIRSVSEISVFFIALV